MHKTAALIALLLAAGCGHWQRHDLSPSARVVVISKSEPAQCTMVGTFFTYKDCLQGLGTGDTDEDAQMECIKWKADRKGGNYAVLDAAVGDGYYKGRIFACRNTGASP